MVDSHNEELSPIKRALLELRDMRARLEDLQERQHEPIAIIGAGLRFPGGAHDLESFWQLLRDGRDVITEIPADRWALDAYYDPDPSVPGKMTTRFGGFLESVDGFDAQFFGISPREAVSMDPQQRLLLEVTWEALENAGQSTDQLFGSQTGVFVGISHSDYQHLIFNDINQIDIYSTTGSALSIAGGRLSYLLGLQGPNISIDTACSSSLVAIHLAVQSLRLHESNMALAGGVGLILTPEINVNFSKSQMMAADGRCKTFDAAADGYVRGEGCGMIVLKRLSDALSDGDSILAVIRGSAINQDGRSGGLTAPNGPSQEKVLTAALENARVDPEAVSYIEAHGTGTALGDPIEIQALGAVFGDAHSSDNPLLVGSVKTNMGHLEAAAGIAGLLKVVAALKHHEIPAHLHLEELNPYIPWAQLPIEIPTRSIRWDGYDQKCIAGVSSFGFSGTNAHIILEEAPTITLQEVPIGYPFHLFTLSASSHQALIALAARYRDYLEQNPEVSLAELCHGVSSRVQLGYRLAAVVDSVQDAQTKLASYDSGEKLAGVFDGRSANPPELAFLFTGHGSQYVHMGRELYETQPVYREMMDRCDELLRPYLEYSLLNVLFPASNESPLMDGMAYTQPALFALQVSLAELWRSWGIEPSIVMGHSVGEYAAAYVAGVFSLEDGLKLVAARGRLMETLPEIGQMMAVFADEQTVAQVIAPYADQVSIAVINGPENVVISGKSESIEAIAEQLRQMKVKSRRLAVAQASHSPLIDPMLDEFEQVARSITYTEPNIALVSCTTGDIVDRGEVTQSAYWRRHIRQPVRFMTAIETLYEQGIRGFIEIGPNPTLLALGQRCLPENEANWLPSLREGVNDWVQLLESAAQLYLQGLKFNWDGFYQNLIHHKLTLPTYPFQRTRYWTSAAVPTPVSSQKVSWEAVHKAMQHQSMTGPLDLMLHTYPSRWDCLNRLTVAYILNTLNELKAFRQAGESHTVQAFMARFGVQAIYQNLIGRWFEKLVRLGFLVERDGSFVSLQALPLPDLDSVWEEAQILMADLPYVLDYFKRCGTQLTYVITGAASPLDTLFPGGSFTQAENLYQNWPLSRYYAYLVRAGLEVVVNSLPQGKKLRILEIGAGTGATTASLLPLLPAERVTYTFTDVSDIFLAQATDKFKQYPFVQYGLLDIEQSPEQQEYLLGSYDVVVAVNVLHATRDVNQTVKHVSTLLAPGGLLLLNESTEHLSWYDMTTGLIGGWQRFEDDLRTDNPLLKPDQWITVLEANGFATVEAWPSTGSEPEILGQHVLAAQMPHSNQSLYSEISFKEHNNSSYQTQPDTVVETSAHFIQELHAAMAVERHDLLVDFVRQGVVRVLRMDAGQIIDRQSRLLEIGLDSLMALELWSFVNRGLELREALPSTLIFDYPTIDAIATYLESVLGFDDEIDPTSSVNETSSSKAEQTARAAEIENLSDDEVAAMLLKKFGR